MVNHLETFRLNKLSMDTDIEDKVVYKRIVCLFVLEGVVDQRILELLKMIRKKKTQSKQIFDDCLISISS
jgi:hypothetical protein